MQVSAEPSGGRAALPRMSVGKPVTSTQKIRELVQSTLLFKGAPAVRCDIACAAPAECVSRIWLDSCAWVPTGDWHSYSLGCVAPGSCTSGADPAPLPPASLRAG
jgi:hypothetical protein